MLSTVLSSIVWLLSCDHLPDTGVYLSLRYAYFAEPLRGLANTPFGERVQVLLPELGVFDPQLQAFTDFQQTLQVPVKALKGLTEQPPRREAWQALDKLPPDAPQAQALRLLELPERVRQDFHRSVPLLAWIYLHRRSEPDDPPGFSNDGIRTRAAPFSLREPTHRIALLEALEPLQRAGFEGAQLDLEPLPPEDVPALCDLLGEIRRRLGSRFVRSVFTPKYAKDNGIRTLHRGFVWTDRQPFQQLAQCADQLMIPLYDFGPLVRSDDDYQVRARDLLLGLWPSLEPRARLWLALPQYHQTAQHGPSERISLLGPVLQQAPVKPSGAAIFVYTGEAGDFDPGREQFGLSP